MPRAATQFALAACCVLSCSAISRSVGIDRIAWKHDYQAALDEAAFLDRCLVVFVTADWCPHALRIEHSVFADHRIRKLLAESAVAVRLIADLEPARVQKLQIEKLPCTIVLSRSGHERGRIDGARPTEIYVADLARLLKHTTPNLDPATGPRQAATTPIELASHHSPPPSKPQATIARSISTRVMLDGFCPVRTIHHKVLIAGDHSLERIYDSRKYWLADSDAARQFDEDPARFVPAARGLCAVSSKDDHLNIPGHPSHLAVLDGRLYLLAGPKQYRKFLSSPHRYAYPDLAQDGMCPVCRVDRLALVRGAATIQLVHEGRLYRFDSAEHRRVFQDDPTPYRLED